jgi:hypothetical protein
MITVTKAMLVLSMVVPHGTYDEIKSCQKASPRVVHCVVIDYDTWSRLFQAWGDMETTATVKRQRSGRVVVYDSYDGWMKVGLDAPTRKLLR